MPLVVIIVVLAASAVGAVLVLRWGDAHLERRKAEAELARQEAAGRRRRADFTGTG